MAKPVHNLPVWTQAFQLMAADWLLSSRTALWESGGAAAKSAASNQSTVEGFQQDLNSLRMLAQHLPQAHTKLHLYEAVVRLIAGVNPLKIQHLLEQTMNMTQASSPSLICTKGGVHEEYSLREQAEAMLVACQHLPAALLASPGERKGMLTQAARILERLGDRRKFLACQKLMLSLVAPPGVST